MKYLTAEEIRSTGLLHEFNRQMLHPVGLAAEINMETGQLTIQDLRDDPEGVIFSPNTLDPALAEKFFSLMVDRMAVRNKALGYFIQPVK